MFPKTFFALIGLTESEAQEYVFQSVELKQAAFRIDATFQPKDETRPTTKHVLRISLRCNFSAIKNFIADSLPKRSCICISMTFKISEGLLSLSRAH